MDNFITVSSKRALENPDLFSHTHTRMNVLKEQKNDTSFEISEDKIYTKELKSYINSENSYFAFFIKGDVGTGKSELIWYLYSMLMEDFESNKLKIINIPKNRYWLTIVKQLKDKFVKILKIKDEKAFFGDDPDFQDKIDRGIDNNSQLVSIELTSSILKQLIQNNILKSERLVNEENKQYKLIDSKDKVNKIILENIEDLKTQNVQHDLDDDHKINSYLFNRNNSRDVLSSLDWMDSSKTLEEKVNCLNDALRGAISKEFEVLSINEIFDLCIKEYRKKKKNGEEIPTIILMIEDFGLRGKYAEEIGKIINEDNYPINFLIAGTPDSFNDINVRGSLMERIQIFWTTLDPSSKTSTFLSINNIWLYFKKYFTFFKSALKKQLEINEQNRGISIDVEDPFPFSETFIKRIYCNYGEEKKKPRDFIKEIVEILTQYAEGIHPYIYATKNIGYSQEYGIGISEDVQIHKVFNIDNSDADSISFIKWFGKKENDHIIVDERLSARFGLNLKIFDVPIAHLPQFPSDSDLPPTPSTPQSEISRESPLEIDRFQEIFNSILEDYSRIFDIWYNSLDDNLVCNDAIKSGFLHIFKKLTNNFSIYNSFSVDSSYIKHFIRFQKGDNKQDSPPDLTLPFSLPTIIIDDFTKSYIKKVLQLGVLYIKESDFSDYSERLDEKRKILIDEIIQIYYMYLNKWILCFEKKFFEELKKQCTDYFLKGDIKKINNPFFKLLYFLAYIDKIRTDPLCKDDPKSLFKFITQKKNDKKSNFLKIEGIDFKNEAIKSKFEDFVGLLPDFTKILKNLLDSPVREEVLRSISWVFRGQNVSNIKKYIKSQGGRTDFLQKINIPNKITTFYRNYLSNYADLLNSSNDNDKEQFALKISTIQDIVDLSPNEIAQIMDEKNYLIEKNNQLESNLKKLKQELESDQFKTIKEKYLFSKDIYEDEHKSQLLIPYYGILIRKIEAVNFYKVYKKILEITNPEKIDFDKEIIERIKVIL